MNNQRHGKRESTQVLMTAYLSISVEETHDAVNEWLRFWMPPGSAEDVSEELLNDPEMVNSAERLVKRQNGSGSLHAVARQPELVHGVDIGHLELDGRANRRRSAGGPPDPQVSIHPLATLEEQDGVATANLGNVIYSLCHPPAVVVGLSGIELGLLLAMGEEGAHILHEVTEPGRNSAGAQRETTLLVMICLLYTSPSPRDRG